jgi:hypothetical protein
MDAKEKMEMFFPEVSHSMVKLFCGEKEIDIFASRPIDDPDDLSLPHPARSVIVLCE